MRIISGKLKGRIVKMPSAKYTRPTTDKVNESLFNYLTNFLNFEGFSVCDIYAGSGSLGLESMSRGASEVHFIEKNYQVVKVLEQNLEILKIKDTSRIFKMPAIRFSSLKKHSAYNLIFADPPFFRDDIHKVVEQLLKNDFLLPEGLLIVERSVQTKKKDIEMFNIEPFKQIGDSLIYQFSN